MNEILVGLVLGGGCLATAVALAVRYGWRVRTWRSVEAEVLKIDPKRARAKLVYLDPGGQQRTAVRAAWPGLYPVGRRVRLRHDPSNAFRTQIEHPVVVGAAVVGVVALAALGALLAVTPWLAIEDPADLATPELPWTVALPIGLVCLAAGAALASREGRRRGWHWTQGTVRAVKERTTRQPDGTSTTYRSTYEFVDDHEQVRSSVTETWLRTYQRNEPVRVRFDPTDPDKSQLRSPGQHVRVRVGAAALLAVGAVLLVVGIVGLAGA